MVLKNYMFLIKMNSLREDSEFTVDGVHFNDLGFERFAKHFLKNLKKLV